MALPKELWLRAFWFWGLFRFLETCFLLFYKTLILFPINLLFFLFCYSPFLFWCITVEKAVVKVGMNGTQLACGKGTVSRKQLHFGGKNKELGLSKLRKASPCVLSSFHLSPFLRNDRNFTKHTDFLNS